MIARIEGLAQIPAQRFQVDLDGQYCTITLRQKGNRIYLDMDTADDPVVRGAICLHGVDIIQSYSPYFTGSLHFYDTLGASAPQYEHLGTRYRLYYVSAGEELPPQLRY